MKLLFDLLLYCFELFIAYMFISYNYDKNKSKSITLLVGLMAFLTGALILRFINNEVLNLVVFFFMHFLFFMICFELNWKNALIYALLLDVIMFSCELITVYFSSLLLKTPNNVYQENFSAFVILTIISKLFYFALAQALSYIINRLKYNNNRLSRFMPLFIFPILSIAISFLFLRMTFVYNYQTIYNVIFIVLSLFMIIACIYIFFYYQTLSKNDEELNELLREKRESEINDKYLEILKHQNDEIQMILHDTKNHFITISNMTSVSDINNYINEVFGNIQKNNIIEYTNNKLLDLLLSKYLVLCNNNNIDFNIEVKTANLSYLSDVDLSTIVNNLLDNAFEAAKNSEERIIDFSIRHINGFDILNVSNSCNTKPVQKNGVLLTSKQINGLHGYGTKIIKKYAAKNKASYEWFYDEERHLFFSTIIFANNKE